MNDAYGFFAFGLKSFLQSNDFYFLFFLLSLYSIYLGQELKQIAQLGLTFSAGYIISLALGVYDILFLPDHILTLLLPGAVFVTAFSNLFFKEKKFVKRFPSQTYRFFFAVIFGLFYGLALTQQLNTPLANNGDSVGYLLLFILGTICTHILFILAYLILLFFVRDIFKASRREWILYVAGAMMALSAQRLLVLL